jgi:hypothetical protein
MAMVAGALVLVTSACSRTAHTPAAGPAQADQVQPIAPLESPSPDPIMERTASPPPTAAPSAAVPPVGPSSHGAAPTQRTAGCRADEIKATFAYGPAVADGHRSGFVSVQNVSNRDCAVAGFPVLQLRAADGTALPTVSAQLPDTWAAVTLVPGRAALADVEWNPKGASCSAPAADLEVRVNGDAAALTTPFTATVCDQGRISVAPFHL